MLGGIQIFNFNFNFLNEDKRPFFTLLLIEAVYSIFSGFLAFVNFRVWDKSDGSFHMFLIYFVFYFIIRFIGLLVANYLSINISTTKILKSSLYILLFSPLIFIFLDDYISNIYLWMFIINIPSALMVSFYNCSFNLLLGYYGGVHNTKNYGGFFSLKVYIANVIGFLIPLIFGYFINAISFEFICIFMFILILIGIYFSRYISDVKVPTDCDSYKDLLNYFFKRNKEKSSSLNKELNKLLFLHTFYILIVSFVFQYLDVFRNLYNFKIVDNSFELGVLNSLFFIITTVCLYIYKKYKFKNIHLFIFSSVIVVICIICVYILNESYLKYIIFFYIIGVYYFNVLYGSVSFDLLNQFNNKEKYFILFKRDAYGIISKLLFILISLLFSFDSFNDLNYLYLSIIFFVLLILCNIIYYLLYKRIDKFQNDV